MGESKNVRVIQVAASDLTSWRRAFSDSMWSKWQHLSFNQRRLLVLQNDAVLDGCVITETVEPYCGKLQLFCRDFLRSGELESQVLASLIDYSESHWSDGLLALQSNTPKEQELLEQHKFEGVQVDLELQLEDCAFHPDRTLVERASRDDLAEIKKLAAESLPGILCYPPGVPERTVREYCFQHPPTWTQELALPDDRLAVYVTRAELGGVNGYIVVELDEKEPWLNDICVASSARGGRIARALILTAAGRCLEEGATRLRASVALRNPRSWKPALRVGFRVTNRRWLRALHSESPPI